jgi:hypothetical protein
VAGKDRLSELSDYLELSAAQATSVDELVSLAKHRLFELKILIPADRTLRDLARAAFSQIEQSAVAAITSAIPEQEIQTCRSVTFSRREASGSTTVLEWLKTPPKRHSPTALSETLEKIRFLRDLGVHKWAITRLRKVNVAFAQSDPFDWLSTSALRLQ